MRKILFPAIVLFLLAFSGKQARADFTLFTTLHYVNFTAYSHGMFSYLGTGPHLGMPFFMQLQLPPPDTSRVKSTDEVIRAHFETPRFLKRPKIQRTPYTGTNFGGEIKGLKIDNLEIRKEIDSTATSITLTEMIDSAAISYPLRLSMDEYLEKRQAQIQQQIWDSLLTRYDIKQAMSRGDLARMISQSTGLSIPIPPNPVMSIFGKPEISINVNGEVNLRIGWRWDSQNLGTVSQFGQSQSTPMFSQDIRVNVNGRVGDKLKLGTDWNTRRNFDFDNKFKIGYEGYDDDIIKLVEVGNVNLPLETQLIRGGETLFGIRADFQFGPLYLKTLFSQKRGERKYVDVRGGTSKQYFQLRAYDFADNHFFIDTVYLPLYDKYFENTTPVIPPEADSVRIKEIEVWESTNNIEEGVSVAGESIAHANLPPLLPGESYDQAYYAAEIQAGIVERGNFRRLDTMKYKIDRNLGTLSIRNLRPDRYYAVSYRYEGPTSDASDDRYVGTLARDANIEGDKQTRILKLIYRPNLQPGFKSLWDRQMKNIFDVNARNINVDETTINIWYIRQSNDSTDVLEGAPDKLVTILGVDQVNNSTGAAPPDGKFDMRPPFFDPVEGTITFPGTRPFDSLLVRYFSRDDIGNPDLAYQYTFSSPYDTTYDAARLNTARDRFVISGEVSGKATNRINLGAFNLARNSVRVTLDGVQLIENQDYVVDYFSGTLTLRNPRATTPGADLKIEYEQRDIFNISTRTLAGIRGDYQLYRSRNALANLGFTLMHYDQSALIDRVRIGEEPVSNTMFGLDAKLNWDTPWLTKALDYLPFYETKAPSSINLNGEWALMLPKPNKRESSVSSDNGEPVVYIDDFEGAQRYISLGLNASQWQHSSPPVNEELWNSGEEANLYRGKMYWWQYFIPRVDIREVYPENRSIQQGRSRLSPLYISFNPRFRGIYNRNSEYLDSINLGSYPPQDYYERQDVQPKIWGGMQRLFSSFNTNFDRENIEYIEIMMKVNGRIAETKMFVDLGMVSEDIIANGALNTEDGITEENPLANGIIDAGEDIGIDALNDAAEQQDYPAPLNEEADPARDNYDFDFFKNDNDREETDFLYYNNFEGNSTQSELGQFPDTEVLNLNNGQQISLDNSYFSYEVKLSQSEAEASNNPQIVGGNPDQNWFLYRIPVRQPDSRVGNPLFTNIQYVRIRFHEGPFFGQIADWRLVGSQWQRVSNFQANVSPNDSVLSVSFVNLWENSGAPDYYTLPPGVSPPRQLGNPNAYEDIQLNEQSISVSVKNLRYGEERMAVRIFRPLDLFYYKKMKFFIHGDGTMPDNIYKGSVPKAYAYIRFGTDSSNYYEYRTPLLRGWQDIEIDLAELTAIKQTRDSLLQFDRLIFPVPGEEHASFAIKGNPILTRVQFFGLGISNPAERFPNELTTTMWVNELRLISPEQSADWAALGSVSIALADLGSINANFRTQQPNFHQLEERFGNRANEADWSVTFTGNLEKFAPKSFNAMKVPISYSHSERMLTPEYVANNDINLNEAATAAYNKAIAEGRSPEDAQREADDIRTRSQTMQVTDRWGIEGFKFGIPVKHWLIKETINNLTLGYNYSQEYERNPVYEQSFNWMWNLTARYGLSIPELLTFEPLGFLKDIPVIGVYNKWKVNLLPSNFNWNLSMTRRRQTEKSRFLDYPSPVVRDFSAIRDWSFTWKFTQGGFLSPIFDYSVTTRSTLVPYELDEFGQQRTSSEISRQILFNEGLINFGTNTQHTQNVTLTLKPVLPDIFGMSRFFDVTGSFNTAYNWTDPLQPKEEIRDIVKQASYNNNIRFNFGLRLKALGESWFGVTDPNRDQKRGFQDTTGGKTPFLKSVTKTIKSALLDWERVDFILNQQNSSLNPGVFGGTGMSNYWRGMIFQGSQLDYGPGFFYQLGMLEHPHGSVDFVSKSGFPFFGFETSPGLRPPNARLQDNFNQSTSFEIRTSRPLWKGATLDLNWKSEVGFNKNQTVQTDEFGNPTFINVVGMESYNKTFLTFPSVFGFNLFNNTIDNVLGIWQAEKAIIDEQFDNGEISEIDRNRMYQEVLSEAFYDGLAMFKIGSGSTAKFIPSINWAIRWEGLEEWSLWDDIVKRATVDHTYTSSYQENAQLTDLGRNVQSQNIQYGFQPLVGVNVTFDEEKFDGILTATFRWSHTKSFMINNSARTVISSQETNEITAQGSYTMKGFTFPLFGIDFENDFEWSFLATYKSNRRATFDILADEGEYQGDNEDGRVLNGNTQIILEPRARYSISNRLTASFFVRYEGTFTEGAAQPGFHTTQVGLDIRLSIAGGR